MKTDETKELYATRPVTIFRTVKNAENPFVMIDRRLIENPELSWKAKGLLAYLLSRPDNWITRMADLLKRAPDGAYALRGAIKELTKAGHIVRTIEYSGGRVFQWTMEVHETPVQILLRGKLKVVNLDAENHAFNNTDPTDNKGTGSGNPPKNIFAEYQENIGLITPIIADKLKDAETVYPAEWISEAIGISVENNKRNWAYCEAILKRWKTEGKDSGKKPATGQLPKRPSGQSKADANRAALEKLLEEQS